MLVVTFTAYDAMIDSLTAEIQGRSLAHSSVVTFLIGLPFGLFVMFIMSIQRGLQERLAALAATDFLTGLPNRRSFLSNAALDRNGRGVIFLIDADHFKAVNDTFGHEVGDKCLVAIGHHLKANLRKGDVVGRLGGEEFAIYLRDPTWQEARAVAERLCAPLEISDLGRGQPSVSLTVSIGAAEHLPGIDLEDLLRAADSALYRAKANGRARVEWAKAPSDPANFRGPLKNAS